MPSLAAGSALLGSACCCFAAVHAEPNSLLTWVISNHISTIIGVENAQFAAAVSATTSESRFGLVRCSASNEMQLGALQSSVLCCRRQLHGRKPASRVCEPAQLHKRQSPSVACRKQRHTSSLKVQAAAETATEARPSGLTPFAAVRSEEEFFAALQKGVDSGKLPKELYPAFQDFYNNYKQTVLDSDAPDANPELVARVMGSIADRTFNQFLDPYTFPSYHTRLLEPYDYYKFGQTYVRTLINFNKSVVGHLDRLQKVQEQLDAGDNVVLLANHQTEADPGVWALLLEKVLPRLATEIIYVAGTTSCTHTADQLICQLTLRRLPAMRHMLACSSYLASQPLTV